MGRIQVDFNEMLDDRLVLLSKEDVRIDSDGVAIQLSEGLSIGIYEEDFDENGKRDDLIADGVAERHHGEGWSKVARWCCRIDEAGIRHASDDVAGPRPGP